MSLFGELDVQSASDDPFGVPVGIYEAFVYEVKTGPTKKGDKVGLSILYKVDGGEHDGKVVSEWKQIPQIMDPKNPTADEARSLSFLKQRMLSLGVTEDQINTVSPDDLVGTKVVITLKQNGEYTNISKVAKHNGESIASVAGRFS